MKTMRAKVVLSQIVRSVQEIETPAGIKRETNQESLTFYPVCKDGGYPENGLDEDNTFAKFSPSGEFKLVVANPELFGKFTAGQKFYVDFTETE